LAEAPVLFRRSSDSGVAMVSLNEVLRELGRITGKTLETKYEPPPMENPRLPADISQARNFWGYEPNVAFEEGLARTLSVSGEKQRRRREK